jgi:hypothetical protein
VVPWSDFEPEQYRFADYAAYFRRVKRELLKSLSEGTNEHCVTCGWRAACEQRRRDDEHLCLVAGISKLQINELTERSVTTMKSLAVMALPLDWKPERGSAGSYARVREPARIQVEARETGEACFELLPVKAGFGLTRLPEPSEGDIFLDLEGDAFVGEQGLEYLFGYLSKDGNGALAYQTTGRSRVPTKSAPSRLLISYAMGEISRSAHLPLRAMRAGGADPCRGAIPRVQTSPPSTTSLAPSRQYRPTRACSSNRPGGCTRISARSHPSFSMMANSSQERVWRRRSSAPQVR